MPPADTRVSPREAYQLLKDVALETRAITALPAGADTVRLAVDGWQLLLTVQGTTLIACHACDSPDGRHGSIDSWQRFGTNPVALMSAWEHAQVERLMAVAQRQRHDTPV